MRFALLPLLASLTTVGCATAPTTDLSSTVPEVAPAPIEVPVVAPAVVPSEVPEAGACARCHDIAQDAVEGSEGGHQRERGQRVPASAASE